jgi:hypothetical protein
MEQQSAPFSSLNQMPPRGPAPIQLPPIVNPPPSSVTNGTNSVEAAKIDSSFESLTLNTPSAGSDLSHQQFSSSQKTNEFSGSQESLDDNDAEGHPTHELSLSNDDGTRGMSYIECNDFFFINLIQIEYPNIVPANMWTRKDIKEFKDAVRKEKDAVIKIGSGETVTV